MTLSTLCKEAHDNAVAKGFYEHERGFAERCMLIVGEISEAVEAHRNGIDIPSQYDLEYYANHADFKEHDVQENFKKVIKDTPSDELADACIRIFDLCGSMGIDLESSVKAKMKYNATREKLHGKRY